MSLTIRIRKRADGAGLLLCQRADGSVTHQRQTVAHAAHFVAHDLTHVAVETVLRDVRGFFGLIEVGWDITETDGKGERPLPASAVTVEQIVGLFDQERATPGGWTVEEFNAFAPRTLSPQEFDEIRARRAELLDQWTRVDPDNELTVIFNSLAQAID